MDSEREGYVVARALYETVCSWSRLPEERLRQPDYQDMIDLLNAKYPRLLGVFVAETQAAPPPDNIVKLVLKLKPEG